MGYFNWALAFRKGPLKAKAQLRLVVIGLTYPAHAFRLGINDHLWALKLIVMGGEKEVSFA